VLETKGMKLNTGKTKVMFSCSMTDRVEEKGKWPCGVCKKGVATGARNGLIIIIIIIIIIRAFVRRTMSASELNLDS